MFSLLQMPGRQPRNVVLICLDSVRKDVFDDHADRLRRRADLEFERCRAASGWSVPSHASMMTGQLPHQHGIHVYNRSFSRLQPEDTWLGDLPRYRAIGASANVYASDVYGFDGLFDEFVSVSPDRRFPEGIDVEKWGQQCDEAGIDRYVAFLKSALDHSSPLKSLANGALVEIADRFSEAPLPNPFDDGATIVSRAARNLVADSTRPFALFMNYMDAHGPFHHVYGYDQSLHDAPLSWTSGEYSTHDINTEGLGPEHRQDVEYTRELYAAAIDYLDRKVDSLVDWIHEYTYRETTIVITADHGENLGFSADDELLAHKGVLTEGLLHVPLLVLNAPEGYDSVDTDQYLSHLQLPELMVGLANGECPHVTRDRIPAERVGSNMADSATEAERDRWDRMIRVVYSNETKYEWDSTGEQWQYNLDSGRPNWQERVDSAVPVTELEKSFFDVPLREYKERAIANADLTGHDVDDATAERLKDLGYI